MDRDPSGTRDERKTAAVNANYKWGFTFLVFALLADVVYRGLRHEAAWDLLALVVVSCLLATIYQAWQKAVPASTAVLAVGVGGIVGVMIAVMYAFHLLR
jgi:hypothetical protein